MTISGFGAHRLALGVAALALIALIGAAFGRRKAVDQSFFAVVHRGDITAQLTATGTLKPIESITYRSPVAGRELEIVALAPEGARVAAGDVIVRLDSTELQRDADRLRQELRQLQMELQAAHVERQEAEGAVQAASEGEGAITVDEAKSPSSSPRRKRRVCVRNTSSSNRSSTRASSRERSCRARPPN